MPRVAVDERTRDRILRLIVENGPITSTELAQITVLTPAAVRRHVAHLERAGQIEEYTAHVSDHARRGRPARKYVATDSGQSVLGDACGSLANRVFDFVRQELGPTGVEQFAQKREAELVTRYGGVVEKGGNSLRKRAQALARAFTQDGYATSVRRVAGTTTLQLCQGHCPILEVAEHVPALCEAETRAVGRLLDTHVQRLSTIAGGAHVCNVSIPGGAPVRRTTA
ncbi:helix-turn-helix transcriptional regulator [Neoactinobaculum massilliense]|uniref:helix-turn-helix transcriptional regulator n=1 Tax=Neoactinobaculum massilliense TaxID=2364794 RepID=UPI000F52FFFF|nr:winged helix-turn-helix transcriptional regulator [Neoactinobaculum massilliense]